MTTVQVPAKLPHSLLIQQEFGQTAVSGAWMSAGTDLYPSKGGKTELVVKTWRDLYSIMIRSSGDAGNDYVDYETITTYDLLKWAADNGYVPANAQDALAYARTSNVQNVVSLGTVWKVNGQEMVAWTFKGKSGRVHLNHTPLKKTWSNKENFLFRKV